MIKALLARMKQGYRTAPYPTPAPVLPDRFRGLPRLEPGRCPAGCASCVAACPNAAVTAGPAGVRLDLGRCLFCAIVDHGCPLGQRILSGEVCGWLCGKGPDP